MELSWSALLAGWSDEFLTVADVQQLAQARILTAVGEALVPLSDLASLRGDEDRRDVRGALARLAELEERPSWFARREWQVFRLEWQLDHLDDELNPEEPAYYQAHYQMRALEEAWRGVGQPLDVPLLNPFITYIEATEMAAGLALTVRALRVWLRQQREVLAVVSRLMTAGQVQAVAVLASAFETAQASAEAHLGFVRQELAIYQRVLPSEQNEALWREIDAYNSAVVKAR